MTRFLSSKAIPTANNLYPFVLSKRQEEWMWKFETVLVMKNAFARLSKNNKRIYQITNDDTIGCFGLSLYYKNQDPACTYNRAKNN